jgi:imidazole glycerol phosphate synthase glutamine amidotransferase subunit
VTADRPTLAVCLGLQLLCTTSEESPGTPALGLIDTAVTRYPDTVIVPQMGWNSIVPDEGCRYLQPGFAYFANSFRLAEAPSPWSAARAEHGGTFVAAVERGDVVACQFHPELSGAWGHDLLTRWIEGAPTC